jgi:KRAB domain-containing zinc finger protein
MTFEYIRTESGDFQCPHCPFVKKNQSTVHMHIRAKHTGSFKHKCEHCNYVCASRQTLENHVAAKHPEQLTEKVREFSCPSCNFQSLTKGGLRSHYLLKHLSSYITTYMGKATDNSIKCTHCGDGFNSKPSFIYHLVKCLPSEVTSETNVKKGLCI